MSRGYKLLFVVVVDVVVVSQVKSEAHKEYTSYFKAKVNNMTYYYDKKQERINNTSSGKKRKNSNSSSSQAVAESAPQAKLVVK